MASACGSEGTPPLSRVSEAEEPGAVGGTPREFTFSADPSLEDIRHLQADFVAERDWGQFHQPRNLVLALMGEVGEVAELFQWRADTEAQTGLPGWTSDERLALAEELSDVLIYLVSLAQQCQIDLPRAALHKLDRNRVRYPASCSRGSARKYTHYQNGPTDAHHQDRPTTAHLQDGPPDTHCWDRGTKTDAHYQETSAPRTEHQTMTDGRMLGPAQGANPAPQLRH